MVGAPHVEKGAHQLAVGVKGQLAQAGMLVPVSPLQDEVFLPQIDQGHFGGIAQLPPVPACGVVGQHGGLER